MKKYIPTMFIASILVALCTVPMSNANAFSKSHAENYYDLNHDGTYNVPDLVTAFNLLDNGDFAKSDVDIVYNLIFGENVEIEFEEINLDTLEPTPENVSYVAEVASGYCCDDLTDEYHFRRRYLNNGIIKEIIGSATDFSDVYNFLDDSSTISTAYQLYDLDYFDAKNVKEVLAESGTFKSLDVTRSDSEDGYIVRLYFGNELSTTEFRITHFSSDVTETIGRFAYDGKSVMLGITAENEVVVSAIGNYCYLPE